MQDRIRFLRATRPETVKKYHSGSKVKNWLLRNYFRCLLELVQKTGAKDAFEIGCGEGQISAVLMDAGLTVRGCDIDGDDVRNACASIQAELGKNVAECFRVESVYDLDAQTDCAPLVVCCEVLEHLAHPDRAMEKIFALASPYCIITVPREPIWCIINFCMLRNVKTFGNTPGHVNHWSKRGFVALAKQYGDVLEARSPFPFTMLLCSRRREKQAYEE